MTSELSKLPCKIRPSRNMQKHKPSFESASHCRDFQLSPINHVKLPGSRGDYAAGIVGRGRHFGPFTTGEDLQWRRQEISCGSLSAAQFSHHHQRPILSAAERRAGTGGWHKRRTCSCKLARTVSGLQREKTISMNGSNLFNCEFSLLYRIVLLN